METYQHDQPIDFTVVYQDSGGTPVTLTAAQWWLYDEADTLLTSGVLDTAGTQDVLTLGAELHQVPAGQGETGRSLVVKLTTDAAVVLHQVIPYLVARTQTLVLAGNSFVSHVHALRLIPAFPQFVALGAAEADAQKAALVAAHRNIGNLDLITGALRDSAGEPLRDGDGNVITSTRDLTAAHWDSLDPAVKADFQYAQLVEAEFVLGGDGNEDLRAKGVMSYTVGEVKQFFRTKKPLEWSVSKHALRYIGKYVMYNRRIARA